MERLEKHKSIETGKDTTNFENNSIKQIIFKLAKNIREKVINIFELINDLYISTITGVPIEDIEERNIFLKFIKDHYPEINIDKYLHIEDNFLVWDGDLNLRIIKELPNDIYFPDGITGNLFLSNLTKLPDNIKFPDSIGRDLDLRNLKELPEDIKFPDSIGGSLLLNSLKAIPDNIKFPDSICGDLDLDNLKELPEVIKFPDSIGGYLDLRNLKELPEDIKFPDSIGKSLYLWNLKKLPDNIKFPDSIGGDLYLWDLKEIPEDIRFPDSIGGNLSLGNLEELPEDIKFPDSIGIDLDLRNLKELPEDIKFPDSIGGRMLLNSLKAIPDNIKFPDSIGGSLNLSYLEELPKDIKFPDSIGRDLDLSNLEELPETIKINGDIRLNCNQNLTYLHNNIECKKLYIEDCPQLYTYKNYKIIKYLKDNKKIEAVVGFPRGEIEGMMNRVDNIVVEILSDNDLVVYERYQVFPEDITERLIEESIYILEGVYESVNGYMLSKRDECIALKKTIESITRIEEYKAIDKELDKINKELKDRPRIVRDRLRSIFSKELWEKMIERVRNKQTDIINFLVSR